MDKALAVVGEALLSGSVALLLDKISSGISDFFRSRKLDISLLEKLKLMLLSLQAVLNDAEEKQITDSAVKKWLDELTQAVFDADDLLDEINTEALRCKLEETEEAEYQRQFVRGKARKVLCSRKPPYGEINSKIQEMLKELERFAQQIHMLKLIGVSSSVWHGTPPSSVVDESAIYGRDDEKKKLKEYLLSEDASSSGGKIGVVAIVGMGGLGKTTLAKLLYNDGEVEGKFDLKAWACVSKDFDVFRLTKSLLESVKSDEAKSTDNSNDFPAKLQKSLSHKRFLLCLDDIWEASHVDWNSLMDIFKAGKMGSKIIVTTRDASIAESMRTFPVCHLSRLAIEDCWTLLSKHAFTGHNCTERSNLEGIGREIAKKCDGLPLAAVALGGLLRIKSSKDDWNKVLKSNIWDLPNLKVQPSLLLSYHFLPSPLKRCFAYCAIFPKNLKLIKEMVVQLWIAEGLVHVSKSEEAWKK